VSFPLYLDEHQARIVATQLIKGGYDVLSTQEAGLANRRTSDPEQLSFASEQNRALVTNNAVDFYRIHKEWWEEKRHHSGIIIVTPRRLHVEIYEGIVRLQELYPNGITDLILPI